MRDDSPGTNAIIKQLKQIYGVETKRAVLVRALEIALHASKFAAQDSGGGGGEGDDIRILKDGDLKYPGEVSG